LVEALQLHVNREREIQLDFELDSLQNGKGDIPKRKTERGRQEL
jgi:hypothetical protein